MVDLDSRSSFSSHSTALVRDPVTHSKQGSTEDGEILAYRGEDQEAENGLQRQLTFLERCQTRLSFFNSNMRPVRHHIVSRFIMIYIVMAVLMLSFFSIYWGSMFHKNDHQRYLRMLVLIEDTETIDGIPPIFGDQLQSVLATPQAKKIGEWHIYTPENFTSIEPKHSNSRSEAVEKLIHDQLYWAALNVKPNATYELYKAVVAANKSYIAGNETWRNVYETGRDYVSVPAYVVKNCQAIQGMMLANQLSMTKSLFDAIRNKGEDASKVMEDGWEVISQPLTFESYDQRPVTDSTVLAPAQVGLIYMVLVTFFQFNMFQELHTTVGKSGLKPRHNLIYRLCSSILSYFWLSLMYSLVSLAFQIDFTKAFGRAGFVVYWMTNWMAMTAVGTMNELAAHIFIIIAPSVLGFWLSFWVIANISPSFTPMALTANFYHYGYAMPVYNAYEITKCIFFNTHRGHMGRCYGILAAWIIVTNVALMLIIPVFIRKMAARAKAEAAKNAKQAAEKEKMTNGDV